MSADLHDLLQQSYGDMTLSPERHRRVMTAIAHAPVHAAPAPADRVGSRVRGSIRWRRASASIAAAVLALPAGAAVADTSSLPGDPGYGVRRAAEQVWVAVTWGEADVQARQTIAARRLEEAAALEAQFGPDDQVQELRGEAQELLEPIHAVPAATQVSPDDGRPGAGVGRGRPGHAADPSLPDGARADDPPNRGARGGGGQAPAPAPADLPPIHAREEGPASDTEAAGSRASRPTDPGAPAGGASTAEDAGGAAAGGRGNGRSPAAGAGGQDQGRGNGRADAPGHSTADDQPAASTVPEYDAGVAPSTQPVPDPPATTRLEDRPPASVPAPAERAPQPPPAAPAPPVTGPANPPPAPPGPPPPPPASAGQPGPPPGAGGGGSGGGGGGGGASAAPNGGPQGPAGQPGPPG